jgi:tetratricopeptide (TPR) repeat protein
MCLAFRPSLALLLTACLAASPAWPADTPSNMAASEADGLVAARQAIGRRDWQAALAQLEQARQNGLDSDDLHNLLGYALRKHHPANVERAIHHYQLALQRNPRHLGALEYLGEAYLMQGNVAGAQRQLATLKTLCDPVACEEYQDLLAAIEQHQRSGQPR